MEGRRGTEWLPQAAIIVASLGFSAAFIARTAFTVGRTTYFSLFDDAMVSMRYARNLANGFGLVWNPHEKPVEGYTNLLWTLWMALLHVLRIPEPKVSLAVMISGALLLVADVLLVGAIVRLLTANRLVPLLAMGLTALYYPLAFWTLRGVEVGLLATLVSAAVLLALRLERAFSQRDLVLISAAIAAAVLTRTDGFLPMVPVVVYVAWLHRRLALPLAAALLVPLAAQTAFREAYYHTLLPNTYYLKVAGVPLGDRLGRGAWALLELIVVHLWLPLIIVAVYLVLGRAKPRGVWLLASIVGVTVLYSVYVGGDAWERAQYSNRYVTTVMPLLLILSACGIAALIEQRRQLQTGGAVALAAVAVVLLSYVSIFPSGRASVRAGLGSIGLQLWPFLLGLGTAALIIRSRRGRPLANAAFFPVAIAGALLLVVDAVPAGNWIRSNGIHVTDDEAATRYGLALRADTSPRATIAVVWAGAIPYFANRQAVDLLGKSDRTIAHRPSRSPFYPGHSKWDYAYSIGVLRPDVVAQLWRPTEADGVALERWGYELLGPNLFVRRRDDAVSVAALARAPRF